MMITSKHETVGKWGLLHSPIRLRGSEQSDPWCNFYLELAPDKENPGAKRRRGWRGNSLFPPNRWTLSGALRIIFTCGHRCFVDGRIHALIKLMQPNLCARPPTELCPPRLSRLGPRATRTRAFVSVRTGKAGRATFMERYTLSKRVGTRAEPEVFSRAEFLRSRFSQIGSGKNGYGSIWETAFSIRTSSPPLTENRSIFHDYSVIGAAVPIFLRTFVIHFSMTTKNS